MPDWKQEIGERLTSLNLAPAREAEIVEELAQHLDDRYAEMLSGGATPDEAHYLTLSELSEGELLAREMVMRSSKKKSQMPGWSRRYLSGVADA